MLSPALARGNTRDYHLVRKGAHMSAYLIQVAYTPEAWTNLVAQPHDRIDAVRPVVEKLGGKITHGWFAFGDYDIVAIVEMPSNVEAAAFSLAASAGGAIRAFKTTPLMSTAEGIEAMKKAAKSGYKAPSRSAHA
jgi:uncharacterized protein with GYD domain